MSNPISVVGTIATDPKLVVTQSGVTLCTFRVASGERRYDRQQQQWIDGETNWFGVTAFRSLGEHAMASFAKGERVIVTGRLRIRKWESKEKSGVAVDVEAEALGHDLRWGVSHFEKRAAITEAGQLQGSATGNAASAAFTGDAEPLFRSFTDGEPEEDDDTEAAAA